MTSLPFPLRRTRRRPIRRGLKEVVLVGPRGQVVCGRCHMAESSPSRMRGLIGRRRLDGGEGMLLRPANSIHTAFVRFPIDAVFLDRELTVLSVRRELKPWRAAWDWKASAVLELAAGECERLGVNPGDRLAWGRL